MSTSAPRASRSLASATLARESPLVPQLNSDNVGCPPASLFVTDSGSTDFSKWVLHGGRSHPTSAVSSPTHTPTLAYNISTESDISSFWASGAGDVPELDTALDIADILESPVLRSPNSSHVPERPMRERAGFHSFHVALTELPLQSVLTPHSFANFHGNGFSLPLQKPKAVRGLENTVKTKEKAKQKSRVGRTRTHSAVGRM
ncbi:hypothetical protein BKA93DRAFT_747337 [Sparassis latifolia]